MKPPLRNKQNKKNNNKKTNSFKEVLWLNWDTLLFLRFEDPKGSGDWKHFASGSGCLSSICVQLNPGQLPIPIIVPAAKTGSTAGGKRLDVAGVTGNG